MANFYPVGIFALTELGFMPNIALLDAVKATKFSPEDVYQTASGPNFCPFKIHLIHQNVKPLPDIFLTDSLI